MVVLKKIKASTLMETLVATVLIVIVFVISSMILNNLFSNIIKSNTQEIDAYLNEVEYLYETGKITAPYQNEIGNWAISIEEVIEINEEQIILIANNRKNKKQIERELNVR